MEAIEVITSREREVMVDGNQVLVYVRCTMGRVRQLDVFLFTTSTADRCNVSIYTELRCHTTLPKPL
jgi:hypothetical protein